MHNSFDKRLEGENDTNGNVTTSTRGGCFLNLKLFGIVAIKFIISLAKRIHPEK
jgi:hypothetical protein